LSALDLVPALTHAPGRARVGVSEDVGMPSHELLVHRARHRLEIPRALLLEQQRQEVDLEQQVAELVDELRVVATECRVGDLVRLLDGMRDDRLRRLLAVPRAVAAQLFGEGLEFDQRLGEAQVTATWSS